jgi:predicted nucleic acid-binding protein
MKVVVDSNIIFSAILNTKGQIGQLVINGTKYFDYYTIGLLKTEIFNHKEKILQITRFTDNQFSDTYQFIINRINFIDDVLLSDDDIEKAIELVSNVDLDDAPFVALSEHLSSLLWTGDKTLINGLKKKGYTKVISTKELLNIFLKKQQND